MGMLVLTLNENDNYVKIGDDIFVYFEPVAGRPFYKNVRVKIDAPKHLSIKRRKFIEKEGI